MTGARASRAGLRCAVACGIVWLAGVALAGTSARAQAPPTPSAPPSSSAPPPLQGLPPAKALATPPPPQLGRLEQESVSDATTALGVVVDPHPEGKTIGQVRVVNQEVFSRRDWWFQFFNHFHRTTRDYVLERELLIHAGQPYDAALVEESTRNLQSPAEITLATGVSFPPPELSSVVVILPVVSPQAGMVDLLVVTRDIWSLRFNTAYEFQQDTLSYLATSLSENNLFGWRKYAAMNFVMDLGTMAIGPTYFDPNIAGTRLVLYASARAYYTRLTSHYEGNGQTIALRYPLFSLASRWGASLDILQQDAVARRFLGSSVRLVDLPSTVVVPDGAPFRDRLPWEYRARTVRVDAAAVRQQRIGDVIHRVSLGYHVSVRRLSVLEDFPPVPALVPEFLRIVGGTPERRSEPYLSYEAFTARYVVYRDLDTFDLRENRRLGPHLALSMAHGIPGLGADFEAIPVGAAASWAEAPWGSYASVSASAAARLRSDAVVDQAVGAALFVASPILHRLGRVVASARADGIRNSTTGALFVLGGDTGMRGYAIGAFSGKVQALAHVELRTLPVGIFSQRFGGLLFYDVGDAAEDWGQLFAYHDFGLGLRWLIPQLNSSVLRVDWAIATQDAPLTRAGLPGRITAGYQQVF